MRDRTSPSRRFWTVVVWLTLASVTGCGGGGGGGGEGAVVLAMSFVDQAAARAAVQIFDDASVVTGLLGRSLLNPSVLVYDPRARPDNPFGLPSHDGLQADTQYDVFIPGGSGLLAGGASVQSFGAPPSVLPPLFSEDPAISTLFVTGPDFHPTTPLLDLGTNSSGVANELVAPSIVPFDTQATTGQSIVSSFLESFERPPSPRTRSSSRASGSTTPAVHPGFTMRMSHTTFDGQPLGSGGLLTGLDTNFDFDNPQNAWIGPTTHPPGTPARTTRGDRPRWGPGSRRPRRGFGVGFLPPPFPVRGGRPHQRLAGDRRVHAGDRAVALGRPWAIECTRPAGRGKTTRPPTGA